MTVQAHPLALLLLSSFFFTFFIGALRVLACSVIPGNSPSFQSLFFVVAVAPPPGEDLQAARTHRAKVGSLWWNLRFDSGIRDEHSEEENERDIDAIVFFLSLSLSLSLCVSDNSR